jgi:hypothetical protein
VLAHIEKLSDERGIRTPEVQSTTGLAILRHTGLGYLVNLKKYIKALICFLQCNPDI